MKNLKLCWAIYWYRNHNKESLSGLNPLIPNSDKVLISPYNLSFESNVEVTRITEMISN